jgi:hypothetical protein
MLSPGELGPGLGISFTTFLKKVGFSCFITCSVFIGIWGIKEKENKMT